MSLKTNLHTTQNSCIRYCLGLKHRSHIRKNKFEKINWLPVSNRLDQCLDITAYNFKNALSPKYMDDIYSFPICPNIWTHRSTDSSFVPFYEKQFAKKSISYLGSKIWNDLNQDIKTCPSRNNFKHALKRCFFES